MNKTNDSVWSVSEVRDWRECVQVNCMHLITLLSPATTNDKHFHNKAVTDRRLRPRCCHLGSYRTLSIWLFWRQKGHLFREAWTRHSVTSDMWHYRKTLTYLLTCVIFVSLLYTRTLRVNTMSWIFNMTTPLVGPDCDPWKVGQWDHWPAPGIPCAVYSQSAWWPQWAALAYAKVLRHP